jgi:hypothetical protein
VSGREGVGGEERSRGGREMGSVRCGVCVVECWGEERLCCGRRGGGDDGGGEEEQKK